MASCPLHLLIALACYQVYLYHELSPHTLVSLNKHYSTFRSTKDDPQSMIAFAHSVASDPGTSSTLPKVTSKPRLH